jgi:hypothetical protein
MIITIEIHPTLTRVLTANVERLACRGTLASTPDEVQTNMSQVDAQPDEGRLPRLPESLPVRAVMSTFGLPRVSCLEIFHTQTLPYTLRQDVRLENHNARNGVNVKTGRRVEE